MKITIKRQELLPILQIVNGVVERRQTLPILSNLLLSVTPERLTMTASDMEVELVASVDGAWKDSGDITLPARKLLDICRALPEGADISMETSGDRVNVASGKSRFTLSTLPAQEYPLVEIASPLVEFSLPQQTLKQLLEKTAFAMAHQDVRYYLNGLLLELDGSKLRAVATDGHRLALCDTTHTVELKEPVQIIVPRKGVQELIRLLEETDEELSVRISANHMQIRMNGLQFTSKLIDGKFPDYVRVIPEKGKYPVIADKGALHQSLSRVSILSNEKYRGVRLLLDEGRLRAIAHNPEQEEAEEELGVEYGGPELEIGFNVSYLLDALNIIKTDKVYVTINDPNSSCLLLPENSAECKYVVMPMRL
ncbi:MAG: DNA polymerase III subunit beta [Gammaproteobacteria bacterium]|jgi:DNA polymerase-3 subunit beta